MDSFNWTCPSCQHSQTVTHQNSATESCLLYIGDTCYGEIALQHRAIRCSNSSCKEPFIKILVYPIDRLNNGHFRAKQGEPTIIDKIVYPEHVARHLSVYVPTAMREDFRQASLIKDLSPKAGATLCRRCLQGMIRDYCGIQKERLIDEIRELRRLLDNGAAPQGITAETVDAIDQVRSVGNVGAHMEKDVNVIIDIDSGEVELLLDLIEMLSEEWYVARHRRQERLKAVQELSARIDEDRKAGQS